MKNKILKLIFGTAIAFGLIGVTSVVAKADTRWVTFHIGNEVVGSGNIIVSSNFSVVPSYGQQSTGWLDGASRSFRVQGWRRATVGGTVYYRNFWGGDLKIKEFSRTIDIPDKGYFIYIK